VYDLIEAGFPSIEDIALSSVDDLVSAGIDKNVAQKLLVMVQHFIDSSDNGDMEPVGTQNPQPQISEVVTDE
jgi:hypothetical protein